MKEKVVETMGQAKTRTVFIGGVHGVGKSYFCSRLPSSYDVEHVTASSLIGRHIKHAENKTVSDIEKNQMILADELYKYKSSSKTILLDGHFCLLEDDLKIQNVGLETFRAISPRALILLVNDPALIAERLSDRDGFDHGVDLITELQKRETERAYFIGESLVIPIKIIENNVNIDESIKEVESYF